MYWPSSHPSGMMSRDRLAEIIRLLAVGGYASLELATCDLADVVAWAQALDGRLSKVEEHRNELLRRMHRLDKRTRAKASG